MGLIRQFGPLGFTLLFFSCWVTPAAGAARLPIAQAALELVAGLEQMQPLDGLVIQSSSQSFRQLHTGRVLGFSTALHEALTEELSRAGALPSIREQGREPLRLLGSYEMLEDGITITVRLRRMGEKASSDIAVARTALDRDRVPPALLADSLAMAAAALVSALERETTLPGDGRYVVAPALPSHTGRPTLYLSLPVAAAIGEAVADSDMFGGSLIGRPAGTYFLVPRYQVLARSVSLTLELIDGSGSAQGRSSTELSREYLPEDMFVPYDNRALAVCLTVRESGRTGIKPGSRQAIELMGYLGEALRSRYGITVRSCDGRDADRHLVVQLRTTSRRTPDGFRVMNGALVMEVKGASGAVLSVVSAHGQVRATADTGEFGPLFETLFDEVLVADIGRKITVYDNGDPPPHERDR